MAQNPYIAGNPVGKTSSFVGRSDILRETLRVLHNDNHNTLILFGQRRIGKTSILQYLEANLSREGVFHPVYFDLQDKAAHTLSYVIKELAGSIATVLGIEVPNLGKNTVKTFQKTWLPAVLNSLDKGHSLVILFDEFNVLSEPKQDQAAAVFFPYLRSLLSLSPDRLQFVFVIGRNIDDIGSEALSLLKGTLSYSVSLLSHDDATSLIKLSENKKQMFWDKKAIARILELTNGHPFLIQQICSQLFEDAYESDPKSPPKISLQDVEKIIPKVLSISGGSLEWLWEGLSPAGKVVASALAKAGLEPISQNQLIAILKESGVRAIIPELMDAPALLENWDLIQPVEDGYIFRVELLRQWIVQNKPLKSQIKEMDQLLPIAQSLYQAAAGFLDEGYPEKAVDHLHQAISKNPNHLRANELLADILMTQNNLREAQELLERLVEYHPTAAKPRLVELFLKRASASKDESEKLEYFERVLEMDGNQRVALSGRQRIWKKRAEEFLRGEEYAKALDAYRNAGMVDEAERVEALIREGELELGLQKLDLLEKENKYPEALDLIKSLSAKFPKEHKWTTDTKRLERNNRIAELYQRALGAIQSGETNVARDLLLKVVEQNPNYEESSRYLHLAITGMDVEEKIQRVKRLTWAIAGLFILLLIAGSLIYREYDLNKSLQSTAQVMLVNQENLQSSLTSVARNAAATEVSTQKTETAAARTAVSQDNSTATAQVRATATAISLRVISDSTIGSLSKLRSWKLPQDVRSIAISPDSSLLAAGLSDGKMYLWDPAHFEVTERDVFSGNSDEKSFVESMSFSPDGKYLVSGSTDGRIRIWNVEDGTLFKILSESSTGVNKILFSQDGSLLASMSSDDSVRIWKTDNWSSIQLDLSSVAKVYSSVIGIEVMDIDFSPDGTQLAVTTNWRFNDTVICTDASGDYNCTSRSTMLIFDTSNGVVLQTKEFPKFQPYSIKFAPDNTVVYFSSNQNYIHTLSIPSLEVQTVILDTVGSPRLLEMFRDGSYLISGNTSCDFTFWRISNRERLQHITTDNNGITEMQVSNNNMFLATACRNFVTIFGTPYMP